MEYILTVFKKHFCSFFFFFFTGEVKKLGILRESEEEIEN